MTHTIYSHQQLQLKSIARLKQIYSEIACTVEVNDKRCKDAWISAIAEYQASIFQKLTPDEQAQPVAPEKLTTVEISFYDHEYYAGDKLIAAITYDDNHLTQPWVVMVNNKEIHRASTNILCHHYICSHYKDGSLPVQEQNATDTPCTTGNEVMAQIFTECEKYGFEILDDGIYQNDVKLGEVGCTNGTWCSGQQQYSNSAFDAVRSLTAEPTPEYLLPRPLEQLTIIVHPCIIHDHVLNE
jgi:hypothetical protein